MLYWDLNLVVCCPKPKSKSSRTKAGQTYLRTLMEKKKRDKPKRKKEKQVFRKEEKMANQNNTFSLSLSLSLVYISKSVASIWRVREKEE